MEKLHSFVPLLAKQASGDNMKTYEYLKLWVLTALRHRENLNPQSDMRRSVRNAPENSSRIPVFICPCSFDRKRQAARWLSWVRRSYLCSTRGIRSPVSRAVVCEHASRKSRLSRPRNCALASHKRPGFSCLFYILSP